MRPHSSRPLALPSAVVSLALGLSAQRVVSPAALAAVEGNADNIYPFQLTGRYQQVHGDLRGQALLVRGLEFRRDGVQAGTVVERRLDCEVWMSEGSYLRFSPAFERNHGAARQLVLGRTWVDLPRLPQTVQPPAPFLVSVPFSAPFAYAGTADLVWDLRVHANTVTSLRYDCDAFSGMAQTDVQTGALAGRGRGCTVRGETQSMEAGAKARAFLAANQLTLSLWAIHAPRSQPSFLWLGFQEADLPIPGLCASFRVGGNPILVPGQTDPDGLLFWQLELAYDPALANGTVVHQVLTLDPTRTGALPLSASDLAVWTIPARPLVGGAAQVARVWFNGSPPWPVGTMDAGNFGLVTGFTR